MTTLDLIHTLTGTTCGFACWEAREDVCRCSCGGKNHGIMAHGGSQPERTCKIDGHFYKLAAVGKWTEIHTAAYEYNCPNGDYTNMRLGRNQAVAKTPTASQRKWPEVANCGERYNYASLLWVPLHADKPAQVQAEPITNTEARQLAADDEQPNPADFAPVTITSLPLELVQAPETPKNPSYGAAGQMSFALECELAVRTLAGGQRGF